MLSQLWKHRMASMKMQIDISGKTDVGFVRKNNEDNYGFDTRLGIFVLCDGMGGQRSSPHFKTSLCVRWVPPIR
jgi:serine/threonine protein phosphatase PrpC